MPGTEHFKTKKAYRKYLAYIHISQWQKARNDEVK